MGHALDNTLQDILIRWKRMQGYEALWQPGTDHAAIATEVRVTNMLKDKGIDKHEIGREKFLEYCWDWKNEYGSRIMNQLRRLGSSADWERERFTMDEGCSRAVEHVFCGLYRKGWIYKGSRIINWCPKCRTSLSDAEVEHEDFVRGISPQALKELVPLLGGDCIDLGRGGRGRDDPEGADLPDEGEKPRRDVRILAADVIDDVADVVLPGALKERAEAARCLEVQVERGAVSGEALPERQREGGLHAAPDR
jgi:hypothetical protein